MVNKPKATIVISSYNEPNLERAINAALGQKTKEKYGVVISAPDKEAEDLVKKYKKLGKSVRFIRDPGKGKSFALNIVFKKLKSDIWVFTDGDVYLDKNALQIILSEFKDKKVGCVTGRVIPTNSKDNMLGFWAHLLADAGAHRIREKLSNKRKFLECSGYLFSFRKGLILEIPSDVAEDAFIPYEIYKRGFFIKYVPEAKVYVKNPTSIKDFTKQRIRTAKAHETLTKYVPNFPKVKSFKNEIKEGAFNALSYPKNIKELNWTFILFFIRFYIWMKVFQEHNIFKKQYSDAWERVESSK